MYTYDEIEVLCMVESITELNNLWNKVIEQLHTRVNNQMLYDAFIVDSKLYSIKNKVAIVAVNSALAEKIMMENFYDLVVELLSSIGNIEISQVKFQDSKKLQQKVEKVEEQKPEFFATSVVKSGLTFNNFIVGQCNRVAQQAALMIASNPGKFYNPLFIFSESGLGKTHLLFAISNYIRENDPSKKVLYCTADDFITEYVEFMKGEQSGNKLKNFIASHDVFLVDDIQVLAGKEKTELFFFQVFTRLYNTGKQIVITSDKHPEQLKGFEDRLKSRFQDGLTVEIGQPDAETCYEILKSKIKVSPINLDSFDEDVLRFIAEKFSRNIRNINEALNSLLFYTTSVSPTSRITMDVALEALQPIINVKDSKQKLSEQKIINVVADYYNLTPSQITGRGRPGNVTLPRHICWYLIKTMLDVSYDKIGASFSGKDHSTVMSGVKKVENELKTNTLIQSAVNEIKKRLKS